MHDVSKGRLHLHYVRESRTLCKNWVSGITLHDAPKGIPPLRDVLEVRNRQHDVCKELYCCLMSVRGTPLHRGGHP